MHAKGSLSEQQRRSTSNQLRANMTDYRVIQRDDLSFAVEVTRTGALSQLAAGFATEAEAEAWIAQDKRLSEAADPFRTSTGRRWRGL